MKKLIIILLLFITGIAVSQTRPDYQTGYLIEGDSTETLYIQKSFLYNVITISDSSDTIIDSVTVYVQTNGGKTYQVMLRNLYDYSDDSQAIPGDGNTRSYIILSPVAWNVLIRRTNETSIEQRTYWEWMGINATGETY